MGFFGPFLDVFVPQRLWHFYVFFGGFFGKNASPCVSWERCSFELLCGVGCVGPFVVGFRELFLHAAVEGLLSS